jgi:putative acetyltransferase
MIEIRREKKEDFEAIRQVNTIAFGREGEANLVDKLRLVPSTLSFVAVKQSKIVGHILFSPVSVEGKCPENLLIFGLAPLTILPEYQRQGIGSLLVQEGLKECSQFDCGAIVVLGNPNYYSRFGFITARLKGLGCEYSVRDEAFMVLEIKINALLECGGIIKYRPEFMSLGE